MKRRDWLTLALIGCSASLATLHAQDSRIIPAPSTGKSSDVIKQVEPAHKAPGAAQEGTNSPTFGEASTTPGSTPAAEYQPSFSERMTGFGEVFYRPFDYSWFTNLAGANGNFIPGDIEDPTWFKAEMLFGRFKSATTPPMLTTSLPQASRGIIGNDGTTVVFGDSIGLQTHYGFRATGGFWTEPSQQTGYEGSFFFLTARTVGQTLTSQGDPLLAAPYFDVIANQQAAVPIANEALNNQALAHLAGAVDIGITTRMVGAEMNVLQNLVRGSRGRVDWAWGYRYLRFDENLFNTVFTSQDPPVGQNFGTQTRSYDEFNTENEFQGFNLVLRTQWWWGAWSFDLNGKVAVGAMRNTLQVYGNTISASPPQFLVVNSNGGIYALSSNIGDQTWIRFGVAPEIEVGLGYQFCEQWRMTVNYNFLGLTGVMRAGDQVDNRINPNILDGNSGNPAAPVRLNETSTFWVQTFSFGLEYRW